MSEGFVLLTKEKRYFNWLAKEKSDIIFLQETYSTPEDVNMWKAQWRGGIFFSHGSEQSKGVMILLNRNTTTNEYFEALKSFQKNKAPANDG